jgi:hypothetical protein
MGPSESQGFAKARQGFQEMQIRISAFCFLIMCTDFYDNIKLHIYEEISKNKYVHYLLKEILRKQTGYGFKIFRRYRELLPQEE